MANWLGQATVVALHGPATGAGNFPEAAGPQPHLSPLPISVDTVEISDHAPAFVATTYQAVLNEQAAATYDFWEDFHVIPRSFDFGNILSAQSEPIEVFSAFRHATHTWVSFTNGAGTGVVLVGAPTLPTIVAPLTSFQMTLEVSATGEPFVDDFLTFEFDTATIDVPIEIQRIVLWGIEPEREWAEVLEDLTDIMTARSGSEQRVSLRKRPRITFEYDYKIDEGETRQVLENLLFDWQRRIFGVPDWWFETELTAAATAGDLTITVGETAYRDFRVGGLAAVLTSQSVFDVLRIETIGATSITFDSPLIGSYAVGTKVYPLSPSRIRGRAVSGARYPVNLSTMAIEFEPTDNDVDLADTSGFETFNSKVLIGAENSVLGQTSPETFDQELVEIDNETGIRVVDSPWDRHKRGHRLVLRAQGRAAVWRLRGLAYALRGRAVSFYAVRAREDLRVVANLLNASNAMDVANWGYAQFVRDRQPKNVVRLTFNDGNPALIRTITGSETTSPTVDRLTVDTNWPRTILPSEIELVEYVEKLRFDSDRIRIEYDSSGIRARLVAPVRTVFE